MAPFAQRSQRCTSRWTRPCCSRQENTTERLTKTLNGVHALYLHCFAGSHLFDGTLRWWGKRARPFFKNFRTKMDRPLYPVQEMRIVCIYRSMVAARSHNDIPAKVRYYIPFLRKKKGFCVDSWAGAFSEICGDMFKIRSEEDTGISTMFSEKKICAKKTFRRSLTEDLHVWKRGFKYKCFTSFRLLHTPGEVISVSQRWRRARRVRSQRWNESGSKSSTLAITSCGIEEKLQP